MAPTITLPRSGEITFLNGKPYVLCPVCIGSGKELDDQTCGECFGAGISPISSAARTVVGQHLVGNVPAPSFRTGSNNAGGGKADPARHTNLYGGRCKCGGWVEAKAGFRVRDGQGWAVQHQMGQCIAKTTEVKMEASSPVPAVRRNAYAADCVRCGQRVAANEGALVKNAAGKWAADHIGDCPVPAPVVVEAPAPIIDLSPLERFTSRGNVRVAIPNSDSRLKLRVHFHADGTVYVNDAAEYGVGQMYGKQYTGKGYQGKVQEALVAILADPQAAIIRYTELTSTCGCCGRPLEDATSVARGIGPVCARKLGL